jgi:hypothetical protein
MTYKNNFNTTTKVKIMNIRKTLNEIYLDYFNNYLTIEKFAEHNLITVDNAKILIGVGKGINEEGVDFQHIPEAMQF